MNNAINQPDLTDIKGHFPQQTAEYAFFLHAQERFFRIDHMLGHRINLNKLKKWKSYKVCFLITTE